MQEDFRLIVDLVSVLAVAAGGGLFASLLGLPVLLGYLEGGMVVGPTGFGLNKVKKISLGGGCLQIILTITITALVSVGVGWVSSPVQGVFLGAILSLSSTAVVLKCLMERDETETPQ